MTHTFAHIFVSEPNRGAGVDEVCTGYADGSNRFYGPGSSSGGGFCICSGTKWSCANKTAWPCSPSGGPSSPLDVDVTGC